MTQTTKRPPAIWLEPEESCDPDTGPLWAQDQVWDGATKYIRADLVEGVGRWLSAALEDPKVCKEMKCDIEAWMEATDV